MGGDMSAIGRRALELGTATLHEAAGQIGALPSSITPVATGMKLAGSAMTVAVMPGDNLMLHRAIYVARAGDVLVTYAGGAREHGYFGEVMASAAMARGIAGLVIDGGIRDADRISELGFPVFATLRCIRGTTKLSDGPGAVGSPIVIGDVLVQPGDLIVADGDGVIALPSLDCERIVEAGYAREVKEREIIARLRAGETTLEIYGWEHTSAEGN
jgi:4-hydroxy-4-methyl-2-oxoglutarate aldolase